MVSPTQLDGARKAPDRRARIRRMADIMREQVAIDGACQREHLRAAGFTEAEIWAYADEARAILSGRPNAGRAAVSAGRKEGKALVAEARKVRARMGARHG